MIKSERDIDRIIEMAWEDRTPFEAIEYQFSISETEVIKLMRRKFNTPAKIAELQNYLKN